MAELLADEIRSRQCWTLALYDPAFARWQREFHSFNRRLLQVLNRMAKIRPPTVA